MKKMNLLILVSLIIGFSSCEKEDVYPTPSSEPMFRIINYCNYLNYGDVSECYYFTSKDIPAIYIQGYAEIEKIELKLNDYFIPVNGREGDLIYLSTRNVTAVEGEVIALPYIEIDAGYYVVALFHERKNLENIDFEVK